VLRLAVDGVGDQAISRMMGQFAGSDKTGAMRSINAVTRMLSR
jgi:hypothetical protein